MRPLVLNPLFADVTIVKGVGDKLGKLIAKLLRPGEDCARLIDVLFHLPSQVIDRRYRCTISQLPQEGIVTLEVAIGRHRPAPRGTRLPYRIDVFDDTGHMTLTFFSNYSDHIARTYPEGEKRIISGTISWFNTEAQMSHPDHAVKPEDADKMPAIEPVYPLTAGLSGKIMQKIAGDALAKWPNLPEWLDPAWLRQRAWPDIRSALTTEHKPKTLVAPDTATPARQRLAYDELLANQLAISMVRRELRHEIGRAMRPGAALVRSLRAALPYSLTRAQQSAIAEIEEDLGSGRRMLRLLQGDVGSGKTVVALMALATVVENGAQGAFMAPTEILARQHHATLSKLCVGSGLRLALLTGREKGRGRTETLEALQRGEIDILIGTHALFQDGVNFKDLGLAVIDEQHRFGVHQRLALQAKSEGRTHLLIMTATPIPRTLALTVYGDLNVSKLEEKPAGRQPIDTRVMPLERMDDVIAGLRRSLELGARAYWICPLVEESEQADLAAAQSRQEMLSTIFPGRVGLVHGRLKGAAKDEVMDDFKSGLLSILVATTVVEVGVDVPEASIMVIENAERFGLAQLHQLRGRVGRGDGKSSCVLLYQEPLGQVARQRLSIMRETEDGFRIAEEDLKLRGAGEMLGTAQSGVPLFRMADLGRDGELLAAARDDAELILSRDPGLVSARGEALRMLLCLFEREEAVKLLSSG